MMTSNCFLYPTVVVQMKSNRSTHSVEFEQWSLGSVGLDGEGLHSSQEAHLHSTGLKGNLRKLSGINLQIHQQVWKHLGKLQKTEKYRAKTG